MGFFMSSDANTNVSQSKPIAWYQHLVIAIIAILFLLFMFFFLENKIWKFVMLALICLTAIIADLNIKVELPKFYFCKIFIFLVLSLFINFLANTYLGQYSDLLHEFILFLAGIAYLNVKKLYESQKTTNK